MEFILLDMVEELLMEPYDILTCKGSCFFGDILRAHVEPSLNQFGIIDLTRISGSIISMEQIKSSDKKLAKWKLIYI